MASRASPVCAGGSVRRARRRRAYSGSTVQALATSHACRQSHRTSVLGVGEHLHAEVRQVVPDDVDTALVPVDQSDPAVIADAHVRRRGVSMDQRHAHIRDRREHLQHHRRHVGGHRRQIGIAARRRPRELGDHAASRSLGDVTDRWSGDAATRRRGASSLPPSPAGSRRSTVGRPRHRGTGPPRRSGSGPAL